MKREAERQVGDDLVRGKERVVRKTWRFDWKDPRRSLRDWWRGRRPYQARTFEAPNTERRKA